MYRIIKNLKVKDNASTYAFTDNLNHPWVVPLILIIFEYQNNKGCFVFEGLQVK